MREEKSGNDLPNTKCFPFPFPRHSSSTTCSSRSSSSGSPSWRPATCPTRRLRARRATTPSGCPIRRRTRPFWSEPPPAASPLRPPAMPAPITLGWGHWEAMAAVVMWCSTARRRITAVIISSSSDWTAAVTTWSRRPPSSVSSNHHSPVTDPQVHLDFILLACMLARYLSLNSSVSPSSSPSSPLPFRPFHFHF